jgi:hypothetical protein
MFTKTDTTYNGWTNYETWRTNLELIDGYDVSEWMRDNVFVFPDDRDKAVDLLAAHFTDFAHEVIEEQAKGWALDLAQAFLSRVDWEDIAAHYVDDYIAEIAAE